MEKSPPEIEIEKDIKIDIDINIELEVDIYNKCPIKEIIEYLNSATGKSYRYQSRFVLPFFPNRSRSGPLRAPKRGGKDIFVLSLLKFSRKSKTSVSIRALHS